MKTTNDQRNAVIEEAKHASILSAIDNFGSEQLKALAADYRDLRKALEHYADTDNWSECFGLASNAHYRADGNGYDLARKALEEK